MFVELDMLGPDECGSATHRNLVFSVKCVDREKIRILYGNFRVLGHACCDNGSVVNLGDGVSSSRPWYCHPVCGKDGSGWHVCRILCHIMETDS